MKNDFFSIKLNVLNTAEALQICKEMLVSNKSNTLFFINAHCFNIAVKDKDYHKALNEADLLLNDGIGMKLGSRFAQFRFKENMNGTDFIPKVIDTAQSLSLGTYFLGAKPGIAARAALKINTNVGYQSIVGHSDGFFRKDDTPSIIQAIKQSKAGLLILGMGVPMQELWIKEHLYQLPDVRLAIAGGAIIDFMSGNVKRAPRWMQVYGLEWVYRFVHEPVRLFKRYFVGNFVFFYNIFNYQLNNNRN